jgi:hypothetical protein
MTQAGTGLWCNRCGRPVELGGDENLPAPMRKAVHAATGAEKGDDGHLAAPVDREPPLWKAARELKEETGGLFAFDARFGFLRADWANLRPGVVAVHYTADDKAAMRLKLRRALIQAGVGQDTPIMRGEAAGR